MFKSTRILCLLLSLMSYSSQMCARESQSSHTLLPYTHIEVNGNLDLTLHTGNKFGLQLKGDARDIAAVTWHVRDGVLKIAVAKGSPHYGKVYVAVSLRQLRSLSYNGAGMIKGRNLEAMHLSLTINNAGSTQLAGHLQLKCLNLSGSGTTVLHGVSGKLPLLRLAGKVHVKLIGVLDIANIYMKENSWLSIYWLKSKRLRLRMHQHAFVQLAGIASIMDVELYDSSQLNGRYLRVNNAFAKTFNSSIANISALHTQHTLATDVSQINYYNVAPMQTNFMDYNGSVLDLREWQ